MNTGKNMGGGGTQNNVWINTSELPYSPPPPPALLLISDTKPLEHKEINELRPQNSLTWKE